MLSFKLSNGTLELIDDEVSSGISLADHLETEIPYDENLEYFEHKNYYACKHFLKEQSNDGIFTIKFNQWDKSYPALFLGLILKKYPNITELDFSDCRLRDTDIPFIVALLGGCKGIQKINLKNNYISNDGALLLLENVLQLSDFTELDFSNNDIGFQTCKFIEDNLVNFSKVTIHLQDNNKADEIILAQEELDQSEVNNAIDYLGNLAKEFQPGDLLYGLHSGVDEDKGRNPVHSALAKVLTPQKNHQLLIINPFSEWVICKSNLEGACKKELIKFKEFMDKIVTSLYPKDDEPFIRGWSEHKTLCKLGLLWAKKNDRKIHYVLDDLRMDVFSNSNRNRADTSVTESEIKFIARFYENLKDNVEFWRTDKKSGKLVKADPPWLDPKTKQHWDGYLQGEKRKMRYYPQGKMPNQAFFQTIANRSELSMVAYHAALDSLFRDIINKSDEKGIHALVSKYLVLLQEANTKHKIETVVFDLADEYFKSKDTIQDKNLEVLLNHVVKTADTYKTVKREERFLYRRPMQERIYGTKVLDMQALFKLADQLEIDSKSAPVNKNDGSNP